MINFIIKNFHIAFDLFFKHKSIFGAELGGLFLFVLLISFALMLAIKFTYGRRVKMLNWKKFFESTTSSREPGNWENWDDSLSDVFGLIALLNFVVCLIAFYAIQWLWLKISLFVILNAAVIPYMLKKYADFELEEFSDLFKIMGYFILIFTTIVFIFGLAVNKFFTY